MMYEGYWKNESKQYYMKDSTIVFNYLSKKLYLCDILIQTQDWSQSHDTNIYLPSIPMQNIYWSKAEIKTSVLENQTYTILTRY